MSPVPAAGTSGWSWLGRAAGVTRVMHHGGSVAEHLRVAGDGDPEVPFAFLLAPGSFFPPLLQTLCCSETGGCREPVLLK